MRSRAWVAAAWVPAEEPDAVAFEHAEGDPGDEVVDVGHEPADLHASGMGARVGVGVDAGCVRS